MYYHTHDNQNARDVKEACSVNTDAWQKRISVACDIMEWHKVTIAIMTRITMTTTWCVWACGLNSLVAYF